MPTVTNSHGATIEYDEKLEHKIRETYNMQPDEPVTKEHVFRFFQEAYQAALNKGYAEVE